MISTDGRQDWPHLQSSVVTIGNFDGLHLGHQKLMDRLVQTGKSLQAPSVVITFDPHPVQVLQGSAFPRMFSLESLELKLLQRGVDHLLVQRFSSDFSKLSAEDFLSEYVLKHLNPLALIVGYDFKMGAKGSGDLNFLTQFAQKNKLILEIVPALEESGQPISSSRVRSCLNDGDAESASLLLGECYYYDGIVMEGKKLGRTIQVPTANLLPDVRFSPRRGVYISEVSWKGYVFPSITNVGFNPTVSDNHQLKVETHILDFNKDLYGEKIRVNLKKFVRDEKKFSSLDELKQQIALDKESARKWFGL